MINTLFPISSLLLQIPTPDPSWNDRGILVWLLGGAIVALGAVSTVLLKVLQKDIPQIQTEHAASLAALHAANDAEVAALNDKLLKMQIETAERFFSYAEIMGNFAREQTALREFIKVEIEKLK